MTPAVTDPPRLYDANGFRETAAATELPWTDTTGAERFVQMGGHGEDVRAALAEAIGRTRDGR